MDKKLRKYLELQQIEICEKNTACNLIQKNYEHRKYFKMEKTLLFLGIF